jgi:tetratricopeptide (TPR) repeat protein
MLPEVLEVRCDLYHDARRWDFLESAGRTLARLAPEREAGWICWAFALHAAKRTREALEVLRQGQELHPNNGNLRYNLACYYCVLGEIETAKSQLRYACRIDPRWRASALDDPDLQAMWDQISTM